MPEHPAVQLLRSQLAPIIDQANTHWTAYAQLRDAANRQFADLKNAANFPGAVVELANTHKELREAAEAYDNDISTMIRARQDAMNQTLEFVDMPSTTELITERCPQAEEWLLDTWAYQSSGIPAAEWPATSKARDLIHEHERLITLTRQLIGG